MDEEVTRDTNVDKSTSELRLMRKGMMKKSRDKEPGRRTGEDR